MVFLTRKASYIKRVPEYQQHATAVNNFIVPNSKLQIFIHGYLIYFFVCVCVCVVFSLGLLGFVSTAVHALVKNYDKFNFIHGYLIINT